MAEADRGDIAFLYRRAGFGLGADELDDRIGAGYEAAVEDLLGGLGAAPDPPGDAVTLPHFTAHQPPSGRQMTAAGGAARKALARSEAEEIAALQQWWLDRMIVTSTPLREKLALFWHGHFATGAKKVRDAKLMYLQNQLFRTAGSGGFEALTQAVAKDGAMMVWLDTASNKKAHSNENFAREMMELFTLGIGNYTQADVTAAARSFTGWAYNRAEYRYLFRPAQHDYGIKTYLGRTGNFNGEDIISIAVRQPDSHRFVLAKLWSHFAYPVTVADPVVADLVGAYGTSLSITGALRSLFLHPAFRSPASRIGLVKQPVEYLAGAARVLGLDAHLQRRDPRSPGRRLATGAHQTRTLPLLATALGQEPFNPPSVGGWGQNSYWLDTATSQLRLEIGLALAIQADLSPIEASPAASRPVAVARFLGVDSWGPTTAAALGRVSTRPVELMALALTAPEYVLA